GGHSAAPGSGRTSRVDGGRSARRGQWTGGPPRRPDPVLRSARVVDLRFPVVRFPVLPSSDVAGADVTMSRESARIEVGDPPPVFRRLIGQDDAVATLSAAVRAAASIVAGEQAGASHP